MSPQRFLMRQSVPGALATVLLLAAAPGAAAQKLGDAPLAPGSPIGPVTSAPTLSLLGLASASPGAARGAPASSEVWVGATQSLGGLGPVRFSLIANGDVRARSAVAEGGASEGRLALRARTHGAQTQVWSAVSYGYVTATGAGAASPLGRSPMFTAGFDGSAVDTTVSRRVDVGSIQRGEAGLSSAVSGVEFTFGVSFERASRVTTQTITINQSTGPLPPNMANHLVSVRSTRSLQRRDIASGTASAGFRTGSAAWLLAVSSPLASWITSDALAPKPRVAPAIASLAVVQPVTEWLSLVGSAATNSSSVGNTALRDDIGDGRRGNFQPVLALGVRLARLPFWGRGDDTPNGILSFESRIIGAIDAASLEVPQTADGTVANHDTLRVVLLIDAPKADQVDVMGDATAWSVTPMTRVRNGRWRAELKLAPGVHRISVRADNGKWVAPPNLPIGNDDYGSPVGMIIVKGAR